MTWHVATVERRALAGLLARIRSAGGTVACSRPAADGVTVTWTTAPGFVELASASAGRH